MFTDDARRTTHDGQRPVTIALHDHFVLRWAKIVKLFIENVMKLTFLFMETMPGKYLLIGKWQKKPRDLLKNGSSTNN